MKELKNNRNYVKQQMGGFILLLWLIVTGNAGLFSQETASGTYRGDVRFMFYNCENLFDTENDSLKNDEEYLPGGPRNWNHTRYRNKLNNLYKVLVAAGEWQPVDVIGLCEVENQNTLNDLTGNTPLSKLNYKTVHYESPDRRGIDVALLYRTETMHLVNSYPVRINYAAKPEFRTRDILYAKFLSQRDTLHFFINHWPSRWGGQMETEPLRIFVASVLRMHVDSIVAINDEAKIIIAGDFNDEPFDKSLKDFLRANNDTILIQPNSLYNLTALKAETDNMGTHKYRNEWTILDQIIVSGTLLLNSKGLYTSGDYFHIYSPDFLLENDENYLGKKPFRTYNGYNYTGGFSDHLPVMLDLYNKDK